MKTTCAVQKRERKEKVPVPPAQTFSRSKNISFLPGGARVLTTRFVCASLACPSTVERHWLYSVSTSSSSSSTRQVKSRRGTEHHTRRGWHGFITPAPHPGPADPTDGRAWSRGQKSEAASRFHFRDGKKGGRPRPSSAASQPPIGMKRKSRLHEDEKRRLRRSNRR